MPRKGWFTVAIVAAVLNGSGRSAEPTAAQIEFFENKIRPVLINSCYECHSAKSSKVNGGLLLDTRVGLLNGGDSGPAVVPGKPEQSLLLKSIRHEKLKMPPKEKLSEAVIADFERWIAQGAADPRTGDSAAYKRLSLEEARTFWSYAPVRKPTVPMTRTADWARDDVDAFILKELELKGLKPVRDADPAVLLRRVYFDLIGLPPTPEQVDAFLADPSRAGLEKVVDELLASPRFGERWGRYWLDTARYAESNGNADNTPFPNAWKYRDYVIRAVNSDKPYDQFVREQVAGDLLPSAGPADKDDHLIATGFLALTSKPRAQNNPDYKFDLIADQIDVTTRAFMGLSVLCARCHDHKFDPVSTKEYYGLAGIFDSTVMLFSSNPGKGGGGKKGAIGGDVTLADGTTAMGVREGNPVDCKVAIRGESTKLGETVSRGFPAVATIGSAPTIDRKTSGRKQLAEWLTAPSNPLTARVAVNRIWMRLFGQGIVKSVDNFGYLGEKPSHPILLDYLASRFVDQGWSSKKLIKQLVLSRTYGLSADHHEANHRIDPDNVYRWRMSQRRLDAEALRDGMLAVSGRLDFTPPKGSLVSGTGGKKGTFNLVDSNKRSVYLGIVRGAPLPESLAVFDVANPNIVVAQREETTVPAQALYLMNSKFVAEQSRHAADRLLTEKSADERKRVDMLYRLYLGRSATEPEKKRVLDYLSAAIADKNTPAQAWTGVCQVMAASAEFRYIR